MRWEYLEVEGERMTSNELSSHGASGWELVSVLKLPNNEYCYIFKRQL